ncbi:aspartate carbamoyltransferase [Saccharobesus litoralis]|uniref:Aspartate carbamoyltransferase n=2 Tax=Saccharobesus litoralis TaxID=2172099 RepID=A0A2S0VXY6_9ALTE|nr:aspartate carbamoyltransferase [Saccharobesus litoralis]
MTEMGKEQEGRSDHWEVRTQERAYAFLPELEIQEKNRYGQPIDLVDYTGQPAGRPMYINENPSVGSNPNRNKQHGFFFTADNCIGCHACEAACSEKNENPPHLAFRSVGYVEGGSYPDYKRMNISMACNHCDNPVCLKGCPTRAYTKHVEYGAVLQDPQTCFGCGYCTWVCPYNAPQLDPIKGQVSKCNMCVDRLEVGLKPACVSACVGNALDFGVVEQTPHNREQCKTDIPGFPTTDITHPNIRFQQTRTMPDEMTRTDSMPVKYHKDEKGNYKPMVDQKVGKAKSWNFGKLNSRENPLVLFTLFAQAAFGLFATIFLGALLGVEPLQAFVASDMWVATGALTAGMTGFALLMSVTHLGKPLRFYRGFNNLRYSPMSREGFGLAMFAAGAGLNMLLSLPTNQTFIELTGLNLPDLTSAATGAGLFAVVAGIGGLFYMFKCYRIKARPFWNHWQTGTSFAGNALSIGALFAGVVVISTGLFVGVSQEMIAVATSFFSSVFVAGLILEAIGLIGHHKDMNSAEHEGAASHYVQQTTFGKTYVLRNVLLGLNIVASLGLIIATAVGYEIAFVLLIWLALGGLQFFTAAIGRALFYILVIPTTMPGAFFWKNKGFEQHARDIGLADNPATGVAPDLH